VHWNGNGDGLNVRQGGIKREKEERISIEILYREREKTGIFCFRRPQAFQVPMSSSDVFSDDL
jgi:hypothetical protein